MPDFIERSAGVLLHLSSLPSGRLGPEAFRFLRFSAAAGLRVWQLLPVGPIAHHDNPFEPASAMAGNTDFLPREASVSNAECETFRAANSDWLDDWALFVALKTEHGGRPWWQWPIELRHRDSAALAAARSRLSLAIDRECRAQCLFATAWAAFHSAVRQNGMKLFGDVPLFVARDSADVWAQRALFEVDDDGRCAATVGVPPDEFSPAGQTWGFPPYRWDKMAQTGWRWWRRRFEIQAARCDLLRLDHFRGYAAWWRIPADAKTAAEGCWVPGPGEAAIRCLQSVVSSTQLVAEDLGVITPDVLDLRKRLGIPGMRVLQFAFDGDPANPHLPAHHGSDTVCYTGTHDNDTALGWWRSATAPQRQALERELGQPFPVMPDALLDCAWRSPAPLAIVPMQDILRLGSEGRMNRPGVAEHNWQWRFHWWQLSPELADELRETLLRHGRAGRRP